MCAVMYNSLRHRSFLTRCYPSSRAVTVVTHICEYADDASFLEMTKFDRHSLNFLVQVLFPHVQVMERHRLLGDKEKLGSYLVIN